MTQTITASIRDLETVSLKQASLDDVLATLQNLLGADAALLWHPEHSQQCMHLSARAGLTEAIAQEHPSTNGSSPNWARGALNGDIIAIADLSQPHLYGPSLTWLARRGMRSVVSVSTAEGKSGAGVLMICFTQPNAFDARTMEIIFSYAKVVHMVEGLQEALAKMAAPQLAMLQTLTEILDARDTHTAGHSNLVSRYAGMLARHLGLLEADARIIEQAGMLHDIGKVGVPDSVLLKPGPLNEQEWATICDHPAVGARILAPLNAFHQESELLLRHHERWDGCGYPDGLVGEQIPLGARILAVTDVFNALTSPRPYRCAHTPEEGLAMLQQMAGTYLDPKLVSAFVELIRSDYAAFL